MADDVPVSREDGPWTRGTAQGTDAVSGATAQQIDPAALGAAFLAGLDDHTYGNPTRLTSG
jgi:hypothetical protein